jgi:hypothetical protein
MSLEGFLFVVIFYAVVFLIGLLCWNKTIMGVAAFSVSAYILLVFSAIILQ